MIRRFLRLWAFARRIPPRKILRRAQIYAERKRVDSAGLAHLPATSVALRADLPQPIFPPRTEGKVRADGAAWAFRFLGREVRFDSGQIDWQAPDLRPESQLWRMNLHYMEYLEETGADGFARLVTDWLDQNAAPSPGAWKDGWNAYALSIRVVVWLQQLAARRATLDQTLTDRISASLAQQLSYLERHLETDIGGNHLIKNIKALLWASACFEGADAQRWRQLGVRLLAQELPVQVLPDGVHYERSPSYHAQVFADLLECRVALRAGVPALDDALARMAQATADLAHPDGRAAQFNDAGLGMAYAPGLCLEAYFSLFGTRPNQQTVFAYPDAGYYGSHGPALSLITDCGPLAPEDLPAHGHGDMLSFELSAHGRRVIVDQGVFEYISGEKRLLSRTAHAHNTLALHGADQADFFGAFRFGRRGRAKVLRHEHGPDGFTLEGCHTGYRTLPGKPVAHRRFELDPDRLMITDWVEGEAAAPGYLGLLLHPDVTVEAVDPATLKLSLGDGIALVLKCSAEMRTEDAVWWPDMGRENRTQRIRIDLPNARHETRTELRLKP